MKNVIEINKLTKYYGRSRGIIDVTFNVKEGEVFGFIGPNGAGKSTTIRTLLGFLHPTSGSAKIFDMDCTNESHKIKMNLGYIPSEVNYYDDMKIKDILQYSAKFYKKDYSNRISYLSDVFEVPLNKRIEELSFGNKKKVAIIQALLHEPKLLILDEPTVGLDPLMQNRFFEVLREENKKGVTIFFSSHILSEVQKLCNRVAIIKEGKILKVEEIEKLMSDNFKRIKLEFSKIEMVDNIKIPGMVSISKNERFVEFLYIGKINDLIKQLVQYDIENLSIEDPSLEEIFIHYYEKEVG